MPIPLNPKRGYWAELSYPFGMFFASTSKYILAGSNGNSFDHFPSRKPVPVV